MKNKVSIIIPVYNASNSIEKCIDSVESQTYKNIEIIVVDDNEPDSIYRKDNENMLKEFIEENKVIYIKHPKNMNGAAARNTGIKKAKGKLKHMRFYKYYLFYLFNSQ